MKIFRLNMLLFICVILSGCIPNSILRPDLIEQIYSHKLENMNKNEFKTRVIQFINETYMSGKAVQQNETDNLITGNGILALGSVPGSMGLATAEVEITFLIKFNDGEYKTKYIIKRITSNAFVYPEERWGEYTDKITEIIPSMDAKMNKYITEKNPTF